MLAPLLNLIRDALSLWKLQLQLSVWRETNLLHRDEKAAREELAEALCAEHSIKDGSGSVADGDIAAAELRVKEARGWLESILARREAAPSTSPSSPGG